MSYNTRNSGRSYPMMARQMGPRGQQGMGPRNMGPGLRGQNLGGRMGPGPNPMSRMTGGTPLGTMGRQQGQSPRPQQQSGGGGYMPSSDADNNHRSPTNIGADGLTIDPTSYTQPAYTTQPGYAAQTPIKSGGPGGSPQPSTPQQQQPPLQKPLQQQPPQQQKPPQQQPPQQQPPQQQPPQQQPPQQQPPQQQPLQQQPLQQQPPQQLPTQQPPQQQPPQQQPTQQQSQLQVKQDEEVPPPVSLQSEGQQPMEEDPPASQDSQGQGDEGDGSDSHAMAKGKKFRPWFKKSGAYNVRISKKIRKRRQNARLRHILSPKNAMMVLHELHPELRIVATEQLNAANQMVYTVEIEIEGKTYQGHGMSKLAAKQAGCENALKAVLLEKMAKSNIKVDSASEPMKVENEEEITGNNGSANPSEETSESAGGENAATLPNRPRRQHPEDDVPWGSLASFALYKLFSEWQSQGIQLPMAANSNLSQLQQPVQKAPVDVQVAPFQMAPMKKIPEDASKKHPVQLLNQLRPGSQYSEKREGNPPNLTFTFTVVVDGQTYQGVGSSKKDAKRECAKSALVAMGVKYD